MAKPRVLVDLVLAHKKFGFSGIPQDARLLFDGLSDSTALSATGLLWSDRSGWHGPPPTNLEQQALFIGHHLEEAHPHLAASVAGRIHSKLCTAIESLLTGRLVSSGLSHLENHALKEMVWRQFFSSTVEPRRRKALMQQNFTLSSLGLDTVSVAALFGLPAPRMDTSRFDFVLFQDARKIRVSQNTTKIIRYHDGLPIFTSDTVATRNVTSLHYRAVASCSRDSVFVCNSTSALSDLVQISAEAAEKAIVIPYFVPRMDVGPPYKGRLRDLAAARISPSTIGELDSEAVVAKWFSVENISGGPESAQERPPVFILSLATIEPRKNYERLIRSWQIMRARSDRDVRLVIVGRPGWNFEPVLRAMRPYVAQGTLLHLEGLAQNELQAWYSAAACFAFPSIAEGFGLPPIEAMQCGCPVLVSDIPAHRYSAGDAAIFCDPYDLDDMAGKLDMLTNPEHKGEMGPMIKRGYLNTDRFTAANVLPQWEEFFAACFDAKGGNRA